MSLNVTILLLGAMALAVHVSLKLNESLPHHSSWKENYGWFQWTVASVVLLPLAFPMLCCAIVGWHLWSTTP